MNDETTEEEPEEIQREMFYMGDPMCSWCWGFSPVMSNLREAFQDRIKISLIVGGLRVGGAPVNEAMMKTVIHHWEEVHKLTGQEFNFDFHIPEDWVYNTEPSCRASVVVRNLKLEATFPYFAALQRAFYVDHADVTNSETLAELAEPFDVDREQFLTLFESKDKKRETFDDIAFANNLGVSGFPTVVLKDERGLTLLTTGYQEEEPLSTAIEKWLEPATA